MGTLRVSRYYSPSVRFDLLCFNAPLHTIDRASMVAKISLCNKSKYPLVQPYVKLSPVALTTKAEKN